MNTELTDDIALWLPAATIESWRIYLRHETTEETIAWLTKLVKG